PVAALTHPTPVGSPLVFLAIDTSSTPGWLQVQLPVEPNGTTGWVRRDEVTLSENPYRIEIERSSHRLQVFHLGQPWLTAAIAVGTGDTPTPVGEFYLLELLAPPDPTGPYGPYAFGLSGFSEVLDSFGGADTAIIGLHGTDQPDAIGTDVSFGCIRLANDVMEQLATTLPLGTPVRIT
ncbi:MAG: L,D-transpeptidase, partial [Actinomycetota bacterium]